MFRIESPIIYDLHRFQSERKHQKTQTTIFPLELQTLLMENLRLRFQNKPNSIESFNRITIFFQSLMSQMKSEKKAKKHVLEIDVMEFTNNLNGGYDIFAILDPIHINTYPAFAFHLQSDKIDILDANIEPIFTSDQNIGAIQNLSEEFQKLSPEERISTTQTVISVIFRRVKENVYKNKLKK